MTDFDGIKENSLDRVISLLSHFPTALDGLLRNLPGDLATRNEGENTWSATDVVGHLVYLERTDWMPRVRIVLEFGDARPFDPVDRSAHLRESDGRQLVELLDRFAELRARSIAELRALNLQQDDFGRTARHPALGIVTLSQLLATWTVHDLTHLHQLTRLLALPFREAVGPWRGYLGVLQCEGHGS